jgi:16S rRNA (uracil1498-N3)-methyltransferase
MREPRLYTEQTLCADTPLLLEEGPSRHLCKVLRLRAPAPLRLFNGDGYEWRGQLMACAKGGAQVLVEQQSRFEPPPAMRLTLILGVSKGERMDFAIQKAVELGIDKIVPVFSKRSVVQLQGTRLARRHEHWRGAAISACEQSGRCRLPSIDAAGAFSAALAAANADLRLLLHHQGNHGLNTLRPPQQGVDLLIGPEGGLAPQEVEEALAAGFIAIKLGPRILRTETAPLAALAAIQMLWGDYRSIT